MRAGSGGLGLAIAIWGSAAFADIDPPAAQRPPRVGPELSAALWAGEVSCSQYCSSGGAQGVSVQARVAIAPVVGIFADAWAMGHSSSDTYPSITQSLFAFGPFVRSTRVPAFSLAAGLGVVRISDGWLSNLAPDSQRTAFGFLVDVSVVVYRGCNWEIGIAGRYGGNVDPAGGDGTTSTQSAAFGIHATRFDLF